MTKNATKINLPSITAGFPSPAEDFVDISISLDKVLIKNPPATFMAYVDGDSMINAGIYPGDIIIIDKSLAARSGDIIIGILNGEFLIKELSYIEGSPALIPHNNKYPIIHINKNMDFQIWGIVIHSIHSFR
jgi:DNA polymerase V